MGKERSRSISPTAEKLLWGIAAGRCEFEGCNKFMGNHQVTKTGGNFAEKAHIEAVSEGGARYNDQMNIGELNSPDNLMLLCAECHKFIDENDDIYPVSVLRRMKKKHEQRIYELTSVDDVQKTLMIAYFANIKDTAPYYNDTLFCRAVVKDGKIPAEKYAIIIGADNSPLNDGTKAYYLLEKAKLDKARNTIIQPSIRNGENISLFALAPIPLLVYLGTIISDISNTSVYQCHRKGEKWAWKEETNTIDYIVERPKDKDKRFVALNLSLSANVVQERIEQISPCLPTYKLTISNPNRTFVVNEKIADDFVETYRRCIEQIKIDNPSVEKILVFPAIPNSLAIRMGMDYMPKTDPGLVLYDQISQESGFIETINIEGEVNGEN